jgi:two-component system nitrate/nitrite response regulator NarL
LLFEHVSPRDLQKLLMSQIDGCVPLFVSPDTLIGTPDMIVIRDVRVMAMADADRPMIQPAQPEKSHPLEIKMEKLQSDGVEHEDVSVSIGALQHVPARVTLRNHPRLSEREVQILDGLVKGHANKAIGRTSDVSEATVKAHLKSILRKIGAGNRTQAAIWAREHGFAANELNGRLPNPDSAQNAASITRSGDQVGSH